DRSSTILGYWGHLLADAAHHKRTVTLTKNKGRLSAKVITNKNFFVISGYLSAIYKPKWRLPDDVLADDAYMSYKIIEDGKRIAYEPEATVYVKYPNALKDWYNQKARSLGGYIQLWKYGFVTEKTKTRSIWQEIQYFWFPIKYARDVTQLCWSLLLYPVRLILWIKIFYDRKIAKKSFEKTWVRIESTK
ncbi:MAG: glycosyltransferase family 2 protein, partial [bacterium]